MWADVLGAVFSSGSQLSRQNRLDRQDEEERRLKMQREKQLIDLALRDQTLQEEESQRSIADRLIQNIGPMGMVDEPAAEAIRTGGLGSRLREQEGTLSSTQFLPGPGGEPRMSASPGLQAGTILTPNKQEQFALDAAERERRKGELGDQELTRQTALRNHLMANPEALFAKGPMSAAVIWEQAGFDGSPPQDMKEAKDLIMFQHNLALQRDAQRQDSALEVAFMRGANAGKSRPPTISSRRDLGFFQRGEQANDLLQQMDEQVAGMGIWDQGRLSLAPNFLQSDLGQSYNQARRQFIEAYLRRDSGAVINAGEYVEADRTYFSQPGDSPETIAQKRAARERILATLAASSANAWEEYYGDTRQRFGAPERGSQVGDTVAFPKLGGGAPVNPRDPMGLRGGK